MNSVFLCLTRSLPHDVLGTAIPLCPLDVIIELFPLQSEMRRFVHTRVEQSSVLEINVSRVSITCL